MMNLVRASLLCTGQELKQPMILRVFCSLCTRSIAVGGGGKAGALFILDDYEDTEAG